MIFVGYQGVGKSSICNAENKCIDFESSNFFVDGKRPDEWVKIYVNQAEDLNNQGYDVFMSTHKPLRDELNKRGIDFVAITPGKEIKEKWLERLWTRFVNDKSDKNHKAYANAMHCYDENIADLQNENKVITIEDVEYDLKDVIEEYKQLNHNKITWKSLN